MVKRKKSFAGLLSGILMAMMLVVPMACSSDATEIINVDNEGATTIDGEALADVVDEMPTQQLDVVEREGILYIREEEKLARDVYSRLYEIWGINTFNNISSSEQTHMDAMELLIDRYDLVDPVKDKGTGEFENQELQQLYDELIEKGRESEMDALEVGAAIEEIDILDIEEYVTQTSKQDIVTVYNNLLKGSRNHLRSFVSVMAKRGIDYTSQYLTADEFDDITNAPMERGN